MNFLTPNWPAPANIKAYTTTRLGWGEPGCRAWMPEAADKLVTVLQLPDKPIWLKQHHGTKVVEAVPAQCGMEADASFSYTANQICLVETADCLPILICNRQGTYVSAIHAGWRGLANGIIEASLQALAQPADELLIWLGPAIGPSKFEVGRDVYDAFVSKQAAAANAFKPKSEEKWLANLYELARLRLQLQGITAIYGGEHCTFTQQDLFYSYRRDGGSTGRMASVIFIA
jgi:YfiH family protein